MKLTNRRIEAIKSTDRDVFVWDDRVSGFGVRVKPSGIRSYVIQYRNDQGRSKRLTIGRHDHGPRSLDKARTRALKLLGEVADGGDPAADKQAYRNCPTVAELCDRYLDEHVAERNKPSTAKEFRRLVKQRIEPALGTIKTTDVERRDVMKLHRSMRGTPRQANLTLSVMSKMFNLAELWGIRPDGSNPCRHIQRYAEVQRERFLSDQELTHLGEALTEAEDTSGELPGVIAAIRLLALTGCRLGEILGLRWADVDLRANSLSIHDAKTGDRVHSIGAPACALLNSLPRKGEWVVFSVSPKRPIPVSTIENAWTRLRERATMRLWAGSDDSPAAILVAELAREHDREPTYQECRRATEGREIDLPPGLADARLHDLRHTVGTYAAQAGANAFLVRDKLGHKTLAMTGRYVGRDADPLRTLSDAVEGRIAGALSGKFGDVVALSSHRK